MAGLARLQFLTLDASPLGHRAQALPGITWVLVFEAHWQRSLGEPEYSYGSMVREVLSRLVTQVSSPVRWDLCMATMAALGVTGLLEGGQIGQALQAFLGGDREWPYRPCGDLSGKRSMRNHHELDLVGGQGER